MTRPAVVAAIGLAAACAPASAPVDLVVRNGTLIDGTGAPPRRADVAVRGDRIVAVGSLEQVRARITLDASNLVVAPGFIDLHSHADLILLAEAWTQRRLLEAKLVQGVTTVIVGNCGLGVAPADARAATLLAGVNGWMTPEGVATGPMTVAGYLEHLERGGLALNAGTLVPHGPVRITAMGLVAGPPSDEQLRSMQAAVEQGLADGAFGLSVGLIYPPGLYSATDELVELGSIVAAHDRLFTAHVRGSSETLLPATRELIEIARRSGARVHHSHLEAVGERFWPGVADVLDLERAGRAEGLRISHDVFPYTRAATMMSAIFPPWALEGGIPALLDRLSDPEARRRLRHDLERSVPEWPPWRPGAWPHNLVGAVGWDGIIVASVGSGDSAGRVGRSLESIAQDEQRHPFDVVADLMLAEQGRVGQLVDEISGQEDRLTTLLSILADPAAAIVSDAEDYGRGTPHPAHAGAFARALRLAREHELLPLEEVVRRMTGHPAAILRLADRGLVLPGHHADLVVFDAGSVTDRATWERPRDPATGIHWVLVNGHPVVQDGRYDGGRFGQVLRAGSGRSDAE